MAAGRHGLRDSIIVMDILAPWRYDPVHGWHRPSEDDFCDFDELLPVQIALDAKQWYTTKKMSIQATGIDVKNYMFPGRDMGGTVYLERSILDEIRENIHDISGFVVGRVGVRPSDKLRLLSKDFRRFESAQYTIVISFSTDLEAIVFRLSFQ